MAGYAFFADSASSSRDYHLRLGAVICGEPCWDPDFKTADLMVLVDRHRLESRYARHFLKAS